MTNIQNINHYQIILDGGLSQQQIFLPINFGWEIYIDFLGGEMNGS